MYIWNSRIIIELEEKKTGAQERLNDEIVEK